MKKNNFIKNIAAIIFILLGSALVLANVGVVSWGLAEAWYYAYPVFFILIGLKWLFDGVRGNGGLSLGSFSLIFGGLLLLDRFQILTFTFWDIFKLWPLLIVYLGFNIIGSSSKRNKKKAFQFIFDSDDSDASRKMKVKKQKFAIGDHKFSDPNWKVEPMDIWNAVGDYHLDFTKAFIPDKEIPINIQGWAGDIRILMPENVEFSLEAHVKAGDIKVFGESADGINRELSFVTPNYQTATRKLNMYLNLKAGSIRVDRV
jgi:lia operon protein LiaF